MAKPASTSGAGGTPDCKSVYIDTNLGTTLAIGVSSSDTVADLKQKVLQEHVRRYPRIGGINVDGLKVKRKGKFYYLTDSLLVRSLFHETTKYWYIAVDASTLEGDNENKNFLNPSSSNNLASLSLKITASDDLGLPVICSRNVDPNQIQKQIISCDKVLGLDVGRGGGSRGIELGIKLVEEAKSLDANDESGPSVSEKDDRYEKENGIQKTSKEGTKSMSEGEGGGICDKPSSIPSEERAAEATPAKKNKGKGEKRKRKFASELDNAEVPESSKRRSQKGTEAPDSFVGNANGVVLCNGDAINGPNTTSLPESNKAGGTLESEKAREPEKHIEPSNAKSTENSVDVPLDQSLEDNPNSEPAAKRRRKIKQAKKGDGDLLKDVENAEVPESGRRRSQKETEAPDSFVGNANGVVLCNGDAINGPNTTLVPEANKAGGTFESEKTREPEKHIEPNSVKSTENSVDVLLDQSLEDNPKSEPATKKRRKIKQAKKGDNDLLKDVDNAEVPESGRRRSQMEIEASGSLFGNANGIVLCNGDAINGQNTTSFPEANKAGGTLESEKTRELEKHIELNNAKSTENSVDVPLDQSLEDNPNSESNKLLLEHSTISEKSPVDKQHTRNATLDGSSIGAPEAVHLQLVSPSNEKKKKKKKKKSAKPSNQEAAAVPSTMTNVALEHFGTQNKSSNLGENPAAALTPGQQMRDVMSSEPDAMNPTDMQGDPDGEINLRPSSIDIGTRNKEVVNVEGGHEDSGAANHTAISAEDNSCKEVQASNKTEKQNEISRHDNEIHNDKQIRVSNQNDGAEEHPNHVSGQNSRAVEREFSLEIPPKTAQDDLHSKAKEGILDSKLLEGSEAVDPSKLSKKKKKSKKRKDLANVIPPTSETEHVKGFMSSILPTKPQKIANGDNLNDTFSKEESNRLPEVQKEMDIMSNSFLATDKEINDVIQNVVESVQQMGKDQEATESVHGKSRKISSKKQNSDAELLPQSSKQNENPGNNDPGDMLYSSEVTKQATLANTGTTNHSIGSLLECGKDTTAENDPGTQSSQVLAQSSQVLAQKLESKSTKRSPEAVSSGSSSRSVRANEVTDNVELSYQSDGVDFNDYFTPKKQNLETAGSSQMLVDESTKTNGANDTVKAKNKKKKKKHDTCSDSPPSDLKTPLMLNNNHELGAKTRTGNSSPVRGQVSLTKGNSEERTLQPNKVPLEVVSDRAAKPLVSSKSHKAYSVPEEAPRSYDAKPTGTVNGSKSKKTEPNLESSKKLSLLLNRVNGHQSLEDRNLNVGRKASANMNGEVVNSAKKQRSLVGVSSSIFKDDSDQTSSTGDNDSDASTRTPSDASLSSDYSDGESNAGSRSWRREEGGRKMISSGMRLDEILRSSSTYKKAKLTASQSQDPESQPVDFVLDSQAQA